MRKTILALLLGAVLAWYAHSVRQHSHDQRWNDHLSALDVLPAASAEASSWWTGAAY